MTSIKKIYSHVPGAILLYTLLCMPAISFLTQKLMQSVLVYYGYDRLEVDMHKARMLALGGIRVAMAQVMPPIPGPQSKGKDLSVEERKNIWAKKVIMRILPSLNQWQTFKLVEKYDGLDGQLQIAVTCEDGKININEIFDFQKGEFLPEYVPYLSQIKMKDKKRGIDFPKGEFLKRLTTYFKERNRKLADISDLYDIEGFGSLDLLYDPSREVVDKDQTRSYSSLADVFTIVTQPKEVPVEAKKPDPKDDAQKKKDDAEDDKGDAEKKADPKDKDGKDGAQKDKDPKTQDPKTQESETESKMFIEPWLLSNGARWFFGLRPLEKNDKSRHKGSYEQAIKKFSVSLAKDWGKALEIFSSLYTSKGEEKLPDKKLFSEQFAPHVYSVISSGKVGASTQRLIAFLEIDHDALNGAFTKNDAKDDDKKAKEQKDTSKKRVHIRSIYWL
jgi:hypothetical protein